jgi:hypothetical protein
VYYVGGTKIPVLPWRAALEKARAIVVLIADHLISDGTLVPGTRESTPKRGHAAYFCATHKNSKGLSLVPVRAIGLFQ